MIPKIFITQWKKKSPWMNDYQVEQDLIIERAMVEIFSNDELREQLAFRGGTALHKLFLKPQVRYSEDIDLVQINNGAIGDILTLIREKLSFLGKAKYRATEQSSKLFYRFESETVPVVKLRLKIEINTREHFSFLGYENVEFVLENEWFEGKCKIKTYSLEELLSTKLRALYQRKKGRDLFDLYFAKIKLSPNSAKIIEVFNKYLASEERNVTLKEFIANLEEKIVDSEFIGDTTALLSPIIDYNPNYAWAIIKNELIKKFK